MNHPVYLENTETLFTSFASSCKRFLPNHRHRHEKQLAGSVGSFPNEQTVSLKAQAVDLALRPAQVQEGRSFPLQIANWPYTWNQGCARLRFLWMTRL